MPYVSANISATFLNEKDCENEKLYNRYMASVPVAVPRYLTFIEALTSQEKAYRCLYCDQYFTQTPLQHWARPATFDAKFCTPECFDAFTDTF